MVILIKASLRSRLTDLNLEFDFLDGPYTSSPAPGIDLFYPGPYYSYFDETPQNTTFETIESTRAWLSDIITQRGPYDLVLTFSQGAALAAGMLLLHEIESQSQAHFQKEARRSEAIINGDADRDKGRTHKPPFKSAIFICGGAPLPLLEHIGYTIPTATKERDLASRAALSSMAGSAAILSRGSARWTANGLDMAFPSTTKSSPYSYNHLSNGSLQLTFNKEDDIRREISGHGHGGVKVKISIPTVHIYGERDPRYIAGIQLSEVCEKARRKVYNHGGGHEIPRFEAVSGAIADLVRWAVRAAGE